MDTDKFTDFLFGIFKSWTMWLGAAIVSLPDWWPLIADQLSGLLGANVQDKLVRIMGILVILVRFKTTQSIQDKGKVVE